MQAEHNTASRLTVEEPSKPPLVHTHSSEVTPPNFIFSPHHSHYSAPHPVREGLTVVPWLKALPPHLLRLSLHRTRSRFLPLAAAELCQRRGWGSCKCLRTEKENVDFSVSRRRKAAEVLPNQAELVAQPLP